MKNTLLIIAIFLSASFKAQSDNIVDQKIFVNGKCGMCEDRIEIS